MTRVRGADITLYGDGGQTRSFCYVDDLIEAMTRMMATGPAETGPINIGNPNEFSVRQLAEIIIDLTKSASRIIYRPLPSDDPKQRQPDISKARERLHWEPKRPLRDGLLETIAYFKGVLAKSPEVAALGAKSPL